MKYQPHVQPLDQEGFQDTRVFTIAASGKAFRNLMDTQYSRKIEAPVREICTNALDSHIAAGCPSRRFKVMLPNMIKPHFVVRDYGVGMTHHTVMEKYSVLFLSSKDRSNRQNGMLGIGRMSPMAYTDGFSVRCFDGSHVRVYSVYLGPEGIPQVSCVGRFPSDEPRGVEVSFPVARPDWELFREATVRVLKGFPSPPEGLSAGVLSEIAVQAILYGDGWAVMPQDFLPGTHRVWALQGCVLYPVEAREIDTSIRTDFSECLVLDFPIGKLQFTPGRETLQYDEATKENIRKQWRKFHRELSDSLEERFQDCRTEYEIARRVEEEKIYGGLFGGTRQAKIRDELASKISSTVMDYRERGRSTANDNPYKYPFNVYVLTNSYRHNSSGFHLELVSSKYRTGEGYPKSVMSRPVTYLPVRPRGDLVPVLFAVEQPEVKDWRVRLRYYMEQNGNKYVLILKREAMFKRIARQTKRNKYGLARDMQVFHTAAPYYDVAPFDWGYYGNPPILDLAKLPDPPPAFVPPPKPREPDRFHVVNGAGNKIFRVDENHRLIRANKVRYMFVRDDQVLRPHVSEPVSKWERLGSTDQILSLFRLLRREGDPHLCFIKMRSNEVYRRWKKLPLYDFSIQKALDNLTKAEVMHLTNHINHERYKESIYSEARKLLTPLMRERMIPSFREIWDLERFSLRAKRIPTKLLVRLNGLKNEMTVAQHIQLEQRAEEMGLEVLPQFCLSEDDFVLPILPAEARRLCRLALDLRNQHFGASRIYGNIPPESREAWLYGRDFSQAHDRVRTAAIARHKSRMLARILRKEIKI